MTIPYDLFTEAFLNKVTSFDFPSDTYNRQQQVDGYMKRAVAQFNHVCKYDLTASADDVVREYTVDVRPEDVDEIVDIVSDGMVVQWLQPYSFRTELLESQLNNRDFTGYSPSALLQQITATYKEVRQRYAYRVRAYTYDHYELEDEIT